MKENYKSKLVAELSAMARFPLGFVVATPGIEATLSPVEILRALASHIRGEWGEVDEDDWQANDDAVLFGDRLLSVFRSGCGERFYIITEADRATTTILLPEEY